VLAHVTKGPHLHGDDARLKSNMDQRHHPSAKDRLASDPLHSVNDVVDEERRKKIARLRQAVADGTYHVSAEDLADKLIAHMLEPKP
jgi:anti-sigma28 factor (negative regulator of flagellin synthesis)